MLIQHELGANLLYLPETWHCLQGWDSNVGTTSGKSFHYHVLEFPPQCKETYTHYTGIKDKQEFSKYNILHITHWIIAVLSCLILMSFSNVKIHSNIKHKQRHVLTAGEEARKNAGLSALRVGPVLMVIDD